MSKSASPHFGSREFCFQFCVCSQLVEISFSELAKSFAFKLHWFVYVFFKIFFNGLPSNRFSTDSLWKQTPFNAHGILAVGYCARLFGPIAHHTAVTTVECGVLGALERWARWRTSFCLSHQITPQCGAFRILCCIAKGAYPELEI